MAPRASERPQPETPGRLWTVAEAQRKVDELTEVLPRLRGWAVRLREIHGELERLAGFWGSELQSDDHPDRALRDRLAAEWAEVSRRLERETSALEGDGILVKDLEGGLVDFYSRQDGELVFLCWRLGESEVEFFHTLTGGFRSRQPLRRSPATSAGPARRAG